MRAGATAMVEWHINDNIELTSSSEGVQTTTRNTTVNGQLRTLHTLIVRNSTARDTGLYSCRSGQTGDEVEVRIVRTDSKQLTRILQMYTRSPAVARVGRLYRIYVQRSAFDF